MRLNVNCASCNGGEDCINDDVTLSLSSALKRHITTIKTLDLCIDDGDHNDVTIAGWRAFIKPLSDKGVDALTNALVNNSRLRELALSSNLDVTITGWIALSTLHRNPDSALKALDLGFNVSMNNYAMISFADRLANNSWLKNLEVTKFDSNNIVADGWEAVTHIVCNRSTLLSTYHSNHTFQKFCSKYYDGYLPEEVRSL